MMKKLGYILVLLSSFILCLGVVAAAPGEATVSSLTDLGEYTSAAGGSVDLESGNVTYVDVNTNMSTAKWAGLVGNATGNIVLGDSRNEVMYNWGGAALLVYASEGSPDWLNIDETNCSAIEGTYSFLSGSFVDNCTNTFDGSDNLPSNLFTDVTGTVKSTTLSSGATTWNTYAMTDGSNFIFAGEVVDNGDAYYSGNVDYQMILPEKGTEKDVTVTTYNLWVELQ